MKNFTNISRREKRYRFIYLLLLFFLVSGVLTWAIFRKTGDMVFMSATSYRIYQLKDAEFLVVQKEAVPFYDTIFSRIKTLQTSPSNSIVETDLKGQINILNSYNENIPSKDPRFIHFHQMALFAKLYLEDMLVYRKKIENVQLFQQQLNECEIGYKDRETVMNQIKTAQAGTKSN
jgi:hypothetical protein